MIDYIIIGIVVAALALVIICARKRSKKGGGCAGCTACTQTEKPPQHNCGCHNNQ